MVDWLPSWIAPAASSHVQDAEVNVQLPRANVARAQRDYRVERINLS